MNPLKWSLMLCLALSFLPGSLWAAEGMLYVSPERGTYTIGETFSIKVLADTDGELINAAEADLTFNPAALAVETISVEGSILDSWPTPPAFSNTDGTIRFSGWTKEKYAGKDGLLITVTFKSLRSMASNASLAAGAILAADGQGSNIITSMRSGVYTVEPKRIVAEVPVAPTPQIENVATSTATTTEVVPEALAAPTFTEYPETHAPGERIVVKGETAPNVRVFMFMARGDDTETQYELMSANDGSFTFASDPILEEGIYRLWTEAQRADGVRSPLSEKIKVEVRPEGLAAAASSGATLLITLLPLLALLIIGGLGAGYLLHRHNIAKMQH